MGGKIEATVRAGGIARLTRSDLPIAMVKVSIKLSMVGLLLAACALVLIVVSGRTAESRLGYWGDVIGLGQPRQSGGVVLAARAADSMAIAARAAP